MQIIGMIPARMGSKRLKQKNLREIQGLPLIVHSIRKSKKVKLLDEIWVNSEHEKFDDIANCEGVFFHKRPKELANDQATSEDFVNEFLCAHSCDYIFQIHSIAPLLSHDQISDFISHMLNSNYDTLLSVVLEQIECAMQDQPLNFSFKKKLNSQLLKPIQRVTWSITGWKRKTFLQAFKAGKCATYSGKVGFFPISRAAGHIIKTEEDLAIAEALMKSL